ncbi:hypothetical protein [Flaviaesturariibacter terrae]
MDPEQHDLLPPQETGGQSNTEASRSFASEAEAENFYETLRKRLLHVNGWQGLAGSGTARFQLTDASGQDVDRGVRPGDHVKIDIPGPGNASGEGFDWVQVEAVEEGEKDGSPFTLIRVRPATNPTNDKSDVAHFFSGDATSNFLVRRDGSSVTASVYGRNEKPNSGADSLVDKARNTVVGSGAIAGASKLQWKALVDGLVAE